MKSDDRSAAAASRAWQQAKADKKAVRRAKAEANRIAGIAKQQTRHELDRQGWVPKSKRKLPDYQPGPVLVLDGQGQTTALFENPKGDRFLQSYEWRKVRMEAIKLYGNRCQCCGASPSTGAVINVDHIKPRNIYPELALTLSNLQVLCGDCNHGKGNWDMTDWRRASTAKA